DRDGEQAAIIFRGNRRGRVLGCDSPWNLSAIFRPLVGQRGGAGDDTLEGRRLTDVNSLVLRLFGNHWRVGSLQGADFSFLERVVVEHGRRGIAWGRLGVEAGNDENVSAWQEHCLMGRSRL